MSEDRHPAGSGRELPLTQTGEATPIGGRPVAGPARLPAWDRWAGRGRATRTWGRVVGFRADDLGVGQLPPAQRVGIPVGCGGPPRPRPGAAHHHRPTAAPRPVPPTQPNGDEDRYDIVGLANFTKALPHNDLGEVDPAA